MNAANYVCQSTRLEPEIPSSGAAGTVKQLPNKEFQLSAIHSSWNKCLKMYLSVGLNRATEL